MATTISRIAPLLLLLMLAACGKNDLTHEQAEQYKAVTHSTTQALLDAEREAQDERIQAQHKRMRALTSRLDACEARLAQREEEHAQLGEAFLAFKRTTNNSIVGIRVTRLEQDLEKKRRQAEKGSKAGR